MGCRLVYCRGLHFDPCSQVYKSAVLNGIRILNSSVCRALWHYLGRCDGYRRPRADPSPQSKYVTNVNTVTNGK